MKKPSFKRMIANHLSRRTLYPFLEKQLESIPAGAKVGNIGSGGTVGELVKAKAASVGFQVTGIDIDASKKPDLIDDITNPSTEAAMFDVIIMCEVLEHVADPHAAVRGLKHLLQPSGLLILSVPFIYPLHSRPVDYFRFTKYGLMLLFKGWNEIEIKERTGWAEAVCLLLGRIAFEKQRSARIAGPAILVLVAFLSPVARLLDRLVRTDYLTIGYVMTCRRPSS